MDTIYLILAFSIAISGTLLSAVLIYEIITGLLWLRRINKDIAEIEEQLELLDKGE